MDIHFQLQLLVLQSFLLLHFLKTELVLLNPTGTWQLEFLLGIM